MLLVLFYIWNGCFFYNRYQMFAWERYILNSKYFFNPLLSSSLVKSRQVYLLNPFPILDISQNNQKWSLSFHIECGFSLGFILSSLEKGRNIYNVCGAAWDNFGFPVWQFFYLYFLVFVMMTFMMHIWKRIIF